MTGKDTKASRPSLISLRLSDVEFDSTASNCKLQASLRHIGQTIPTVTQQALQILELAQPLLVVGVEGIGKRCYRLVGGHRTFQLLLEQEPRGRKTWAILLTNADAQTLARHEAFDAVVSKLIQRPDGKDLAVIAAALQGNEKLRKDVSSLLPVTTDNELATALGMSRTTLYRQTEAVKETSARFLERHEPEKKIDLEFDLDEEA
jgi:AraC-like DNA-binding protein